MDYMAKADRDQGSQNLETKTTSVAPQFEKHDIVELNSIRKDAIDRLYDNSLPYEQKQSFKLGIAELEEEILKSSFYQWVETREMPHELGTSIKFSKEQRATINNRPQIDFKVDDWTDIGIKLGVYDITFLKFSTNRTNVFKYEVCNISPLELELLRQLGWDKFIVEPEMNKYKQTIYRINKELRYIVGIDELPIIKNRRRYDLNGLDISVYDSDEKFVDAQEVIEDKAIGMTFNPPQDEDRDKDVMQDHLRDKHKDRQSNVYIPSWDRDDEGY
tara:strand:- start:1547 stop:2368 length:822 start_codon:yes stop_codon:yes gene_type:complete